MVAAPTLPLLFLALPAGAAADLLDRRHLLIGSSLLMAAASAGMAVLWIAGLVTPGRLVALGLLLGVGIAVFSPAWQALLPALVPMVLVPGAVALNSSMGGVATAIGPVLGGLLVATVGPGWAFAVAAIGYTTILFTVSVSRPLEWRQEGTSIGVAVATGLRYLRFSPAYRWLLLIGFLFGFAAAALGAMLPSITSDVLRGESALYGALLGAIGVGALFGGLTRRWGSDLFGGQLVPWSILLFGMAGAVVGTSRVILLTAAAMFFAGLLRTWFLATLDSTFQMLTPDWVRGRTMSAFTLSMVGLAPLGAVASGALGDLIGAAASLRVFCLLVVGLGVAALKIPVPPLDRIEPPVVPELEFGESPGGQVTSAPVMVITTWTIEEDEFEPFLDVLAELRRIRLSTGAYRWAANWHADDVRRISEVFMVHSWQEHLQQHRRLDTSALETIRRAETFGRHEARKTTRLLTFDVDDPSRRPHWAALLADHQEMHRPHPKDGRS